jgi:hypothetical protein
MVVEMFHASFEAHVEVHIARRHQRRAKRAAYQLDQWIQDILPDTLLEAEGVDGRLAMMLALLDLTHRHRDIEASVARRLGHGVRSGGGAYDTFVARIITSELLFWLDVWLWVLPRLSRSN